MFHRLARFPTADESWFVLALSESPPPAGPPQDDLQRRIEACRRKPPLPVRPMLRYPAYPDLSWVDRLP
jgi:hypothetical protein